MFQGDCRKGEGMYETSAHILYNYSVYRSINRSIGVYTTDIMSLVDVWNCSESLGCHARSLCVMAGDE